MGHCELQNLNPAVVQETAYMYSNYGDHTTILPDFIIIQNPLNPIHLENKNY